SASPRSNRLTDAVFRAVSMIAFKLEGGRQRWEQGGGWGVQHRVNPAPCHPGHQCGSLIGKAGAKIREIRSPEWWAATVLQGLWELIQEGEHHPAGPAMSSGGSEGKQGVCEVPCQGSGEAGNTIISFASCEHGAQVQVAGDLLPNSTERAVTCVRQICAVILEDCQGPPSPGGICYPLPPQGFPCPSGPKHQGPPVWKPIGAPCLSGAGGYAQLSAVLLWASLLTPSLSFQLIGCIIGRHGSKISEIGRCQAPTSRLATRPRAPVSGIFLSCFPSLETAKSTSQVPPGPGSVDLGMGFSQPLAQPVSFLALSPSSVAGPNGGTTTYTTKISAANGTKKADRQKFSPY
uniref:K Homology domain-containing protein n=1 Tax=Malurus cyaneus samueli TaxID=2593467 RepID=A0A8C5TBC7_9PASS